MSSSRGPAGTSSPPKPRSAASVSDSRQAARLSGEAAEHQRCTAPGSRMCSKTPGSADTRRKTPRPATISAMSTLATASARILMRPRLSRSMVPSVRAATGPSGTGRVVTRSARKVTAASAAVIASGSRSDVRARSATSASAPAASKAAPSLSHSPRSSGCRASTTPTLTGRERSGCATPPGYVSARYPCQRFRVSPPAPVRSSCRFPVREMTPHQGRIHPAVAEREALAERDELVRERLGEADAEHELLHLVLCQNPAQGLTCCFCVASSVAGLALPGTYSSGLRAELIAVAQAFLRPFVRAAGRLGRAVLQRGSGGLRLRCRGRRRAGCGR